MVNAKSENNTIRVSVKNTSNITTVNAGSSNVSNAVNASNNKAQVYEQMALEHANNAKNYAEQAEQSAINSANSAQQAQDSADSILLNESFIAVSENLEPINTVANSIQNVDFVGENIEQINQLVDDLEALGDTTNIAIVATNISDVNKTAENIEAVKNVSNNTDDIDVIVNNLSSINYVAENIEDIQTVEENKELVLNKVADAKEYAESASSNANIATNQATIATSQAGIATSQATIATNQASTAAQQANISKDYSNISKQWAISDGVVESTDYSSKHYAQVAKNEAVIAIEKASNANQSANTASQMASNASQSASSAKESEENALEHANSIVGKVEEAIQQAEIATAQAIIATNQASNASVSASNAGNSETEAKKSEENALTYSNNAKEKSDLAVTNAEIAITNAEIATTQASNALQSEKNAKTSEANALTYSNSASNSASQSQAYSLEAKAFRDEAEEIVANASNDASWGNIGGNLSDQTDLKTELDNKVSLDTLVEADFVKTENLVEAPFLGENHITNCLLEVPQNIKLELNDGVLTLKAGSKVIVPNGAGVFEDLALSVDTTATQTSNDTRLYFYNGRYIEKFPVAQCYSGTTAPTAYTYMFWFDRTNNKVKKTSDGGATWEEGWSLPFAICTATGGVLTSINQVFNGFGYIGSAVWVDKGVKGLIPDGRNEDGTLRNIEFSTKTVKTFGYTGAVGQWFFGLNANGSEVSCPKAFYYEQNSQPVVTDNTQIWYNPIENKFYYSRWENTTNFEPKDICIVASKTYDSNTNIISFSSKQPFRAVDYNELKSYIVETYVNGTSWYRVYSDGWCEQGGKVANASTGSTITFLKPFTNANYTLTGALLEGSYTTTYEHFNIASVTETGFYFRAFDNYGLLWEAKGYIA